MSTGIRRILCATDLSGNCDHIYNCAMKLAGERGAGLLVVHVISQRSIRAAKALAYFLNESQNDVVKEKAYCALRRMKEQLASFIKKEIKDHPEYPGLVEHLLVFPGKVAEEIVEKANRFGCEAIVLGSHRPGFLSAFFSCGTLMHVLKQTNKPVFQVSVKKGKISITTYPKDPFPEGQVFDPGLILQNYQKDKMAEDKSVKQTDAKKMADPEAATIDPASRQMIQRAH